MYKGQELGTTIPAEAEQVSLLAQDLQAQLMEQAGDGEISPGVIAFSTRSAVMSLMGIVADLEVRVKNLENAG